MENKTKEIITQENKSLSLDTQKNFNVNSYDLDLAITKTRNGEFITFDDFRQSLESKTNQSWGQRAYFIVLEELGFICRTPQGTKVLYPDGKERTTRSTYMPCTKNKNYSEEFDDLIIYDYEKHIFGFNLEVANSFFDEEMISVMLEEKDRIESELKEIEAVRKQINALRAKERRLNNRLSSK